MESTIVAGDVVRVIVPIHSKITRGNIMLVQIPFQGKSINVLLRVVGLPGETIYLSDQNMLINNVANEEIKIVGRFSTLLNRGASHAVVAPYTIPMGHYFLIGDNIEHAYDSRFLGAIPKDRILGKVSGFDPE